MKKNRLISQRWLCFLIVFWGLNIEQSVFADNSEKLFAQAKDAFGREDFIESARLCWKYIVTNKEGAPKYESAQFFLAQALDKLGLHHGAVEFFFQVANNRQTPGLLSRTLKSLEATTLKHPFDEGLIIRDLVADTDFGDLSEDLLDFVYFWQGVTNLHLGLGEWAAERFNKIAHQGYYFYQALYIVSIRLLNANTPKDREEAVESFAYLFGGLDLGAALEAQRRRGEGDTKLGYAIKALINDDNAVNVRFDRLSRIEEWEVELAMLGLARIAAETQVLIERAKDTEEEAFGRPISYFVQIGGMPIYRRSIRFEDRAPAIKAVAARLESVRKIYGQSLHSLARLLYEQKRYAAAYDTLGQIPRKTELSSEVLLERAWAKYKSGDPHRAMGLLYAMDAPAFHAIFAPEKYILRGLIYRRFCHFRAAKIAAREFRLAFGKALREIKNGKQLTKIEKVKEAALRRVQSRKLFLFIRLLKQERDALDNYEEEWAGKNGLRSYLRNLYAQKIKQMKVELERSMDISTKEVAEEMLRAEEQINLLEYEVGQAIFQRVSEAVSSTSVRKQAAKVPISSQRVYYRFGGEYWTDELPHYKFNIEDRCVEQ